MVGPPRVWTYTLFILHLSSAIALFYLLKFVQEKVYPAFAKRMRTAITTLNSLSSACPSSGMRGIQGRIERFPEAELASTWFNGILHRGDRVLVDFPWEAPVEFHFMAAGLGRGPLFVEPTPGHALYVLVGPGGWTDPGACADPPPLRGCDGGEVGKGAGLAQTGDLLGQVGQADW